jgi:hypothetical protein
MEDHCHVFQQKKMGETGGLRRTGMHLHQTSSPLYAKKMDMRATIGVYYYDGLSKAGTMDVVFLDLFVTEEKLREQRSHDDEAVAAWMESTQKTHDKEEARERTTQMSLGLTT